MGSGLSRHEDEVLADKATTKGRNVVESNDEAANQTGASTGSSETSSENGCPMKRKDGSYSYDWGALFRKDFPHGPGGRKPISQEEARSKVASSEEKDDSACPVKHTTPTASDGCPVKHQEYNVYSQPIDPKNNMPQVANQLPAPGQSKPLPTERVASTIPKGGAQEGTTWTYPSPQMFYNALARKGKLADTDEKEIESVVALHNNMNEKTWRKVLEWEAAIMGEDSPPPKLLKFMGRPTDLSPKAWFKHKILGHPLPYDRHDWTVLREDGTTLRYVIDYYHDETLASEQESSAMPCMQDHTATPSLLVDVRPALDGLTPLWNRLVTMPVARHISGSTNFEPLPLRPTESMKSQVQESLEVWQSIQAAASGCKSDDDAPARKIESLSQSEAKEIAENFAKALNDCRKARRLLDLCKSEEECAKASMDWTICMGKGVCPLQHKTLLSALEGDDESAIEAALERVNECVAVRSQEHVLIKKAFPKLR